jgi:hypothetical protein
MRRSRVERAGSWTKAAERRRRARRDSLPRREPVALADDAVLRENHPLALVGDASTDDVRLEFVGRACLSNLGVQRRGGSVRELHVSCHARLASASGGAKPDPTLALRDASLNRKVD